MKMTKNKLKNVSNAEIEVALEKAGNAQGAAKRLGVAKQSLYSELKKRNKVLGPTLRDMTVD